MKKIYFFIIVLGIGIYTLYLYLIGGLAFYINLKYATFSLGASIVCLIVGLGGIIWQRKNIHLDKEFLKDPKLVAIFITLILGVLSPFGLILTAVILLIPFRNSKLDSWLCGKSWGIVPFIFLLVLAVLPIKTLSPLQAQQVSNNPSTSILTSQSVIDSFRSDYANYQFADWIKSIYVNPDPTFYKDKPVKVVGFINEYKTDNDELFQVTRYVIRCCAVDATPVGILVKSEWRSQFEINQWVEVQGKFAVQEIGGENEIVIIPDSIKVIDQPKDPYIF